jgi:hypothetical protein
VWASVESLSDPFNPRAEEALAAASHILWSLSGRKYSGSHNVVEFYDVSSGLGSFDRLVQSQAALFASSGYTNSCVNCGFPHRMRLRHQPVQRVLSVEINGTVVDPSEYALLNHAILGFVPGHLACVASCVRVSYIWGTNPPAGGRAAATMLAEQLLLAWDNDDECRLPARVTNVSRQGVSWTILDPQDFLNDGRTGIYTIDLFLKSVNPDKARRPARVFSPDLPQAVTVVQDTTPPSIEVNAADLTVLAAGEVAWHVTPADLWPVGAYTPYALINGTTYDSTYFTLNSDSSQTFTLPAAETFTVVEGDTFIVKANPTAPGPDVTVSSGVVRFVQA